MIRELQKPAPDRKRLGAFVSTVVDHSTDFTHRTLAPMLKTHGLLTPEQRRKWAEPETKRDDRFEESWMFNQAVNFFLGEIKATSEQRKITMVVKNDLVRLIKVLRKNMDRNRDEFIAEMLNPFQPDNDVL